MFKEPKSGRLESIPKTCTATGRSKVMEWPESSVGNNVSRKKRVRWIDKRWKGW